MALLGWLSFLFAFSHFFVDGNGGVRLFLFTLDPSLLDQRGQL